MAQSSASRLLGLGLVLVAAALFPLQNYVYELSKQRPAHPTVVWPGNLLSHVSLGYRSVLADLVFFKAMGTDNKNTDDWVYFYQAIEQVTDIDARFAYAYQAGGLVLAGEAHLIQLSNRILEKGMDRLPQNYWLPLWRGFNAYYYLSDYQAAEQYFKLASERCSIPSVAEMLLSLSRHALAAAGHPEDAWQLLNRSFATKDPVQKKQLEAEFLDFKNKMQVALLAKQVRLFKDLFGRDPQSAQALISAGLLKVIPLSQHGQPYYFNVQTHRFEDHE